MITVFPFALFIKKLGYPPALVGIATYLTTQGIYDLLKHTFEHRLAKTSCSLHQILK